MSDDSTISAGAGDAQMPTVGPYKAVRKLGRGAMGDVFLAEQTQPLRRQVALKLIRPGMGTAQLVSRFERERQALAMMDHPNVARVFDAGATPDGRPYFVMEYVPGLAITKYCDDHKLANRDRLLIFKDVCDAVQHAHQKGVIHRDIKPSNILVAGPVVRPIPKVIDFGVAKALGARLADDTFATQVGQLVGTPAYMSPEQANPFFEDVDSRSDVYSLGVLLYELISGVLPFDFTRCLEKGSVGEIQRVILEREPSLPSTRFSDLGEAATKIAEKHGTDVHRLRRELKGDLDWIVMKALEKDRSRRYATVLDLERDIERHLRSEPVSAGPPTLRYRARKFLRRRRGALTIGGLAAALLVAATVVGLAARSLRSTQLKLRFHQAKLLVYNAPATAAEQLYAIIEEEPQFIDARNELAFLLHRENRIPDAITVAEATVAGKHETGPAHLLLAQIYEHRDPALAAQHLSEGRRLLPNDKYYQALSLPPEESAKAVALLGELLSADHTNFDVRWNRAWRYFDLRQYERMLEDANHLLGNYPNSAAALSTRGKALRGLGKLDEAIADFTQAIELNPDHAPPYVDRGEAFHEDGQSQQAIQNYTRAIGIEPKFADAHAQRGLAYLRAGRAVEAGIDCDEALRLQPDGALGYLCRARLRARDRHYDEALADLDHAIQLKPNDPRFLFERAYQLRRVGRYEAAIADYSKCLALGQDRPELAYCNRALAHARLDQFDAALADYGSGLAVSSSSYCHYGRARVLRWLGRYAEALADHDRALSIEPENADYCSGRGVTRWLSGDFNGAAADIEGFLSKTSGATDERAFKMLWLWQIYATLGDAERAATALEEAAAMPGEWPAHIIAYVRDQSSIDEVITKSTDNGKKCEAYYYFGAKALVDGRKADAAEWFKKCVDLRYRDYAEYDLALGLLPTLAVQ